MKVNILNFGLLRIIRNCAVDLVAAILSSACSGETDWIVSNCLGLFLYDLVNVTIVLVPEWQAQGSKERTRGNAFPGIDHVEGVFRYVEEFRDAVMSREFANDVGARY